MSETHAVFNQSPPFADINLFASDTPLRDSVAREGGGAAASELNDFGKRLGGAESFERGRLANVYPPVLHRFNEKGFPLDRVDFHPAYHACMAASMAAGLHMRSWAHLAEPGGTPEPGAHVVRAAGIYLTTQVEAGHVCPITMTHAAVATLLHRRDLAANLIPKILAKTYDPTFKPWTEKTAITLGMGMTEKQGGTDVRANTTKAAPDGTGEIHTLTGHKWFLSAPMCDAFLMLAQAPGGLSCFFVPRFLPDGSQNRLRLQRLKAKLGNHSNASSEVDIDGASGWLIGEEGRGVRTIIDMVTLTRLDCAVASAGQMRLALALAVHHCRHRTVFQKKLIDQPLMAQVLADLALDVEAATVLAFRLAASFDAPASDEAAAAWRRIMTPVTKYWICKIAPILGTEALECLGGNGYVEEGPMARLYRELPLNAIWEGSGNVMGLDLLRALTDNPSAFDMVLDQIDHDAAGAAPLHAAIDALRGLAPPSGPREQDARLLLDRLAVVAAGAILHAHAPPAVADAYLASRLNGAVAKTYGSGTAHADCGAILDRAVPAVS